MLVLADVFPIVMLVGHIDEVVIHVRNSFRHFLNGFVQLVAAVLQFVHAEPGCVIRRQWLSVQAGDGAGHASGMNGVAE